MGRPVSSPLSKILNLRLMTCSLIRWLPNQRKKFLVVYRKMKDRTTVQQKSANGGENKHTWTRTGWAPLHQFPPPRVKGSSQSGEQMSSQLFFLLLRYHRCNALEENICLSIDHQPRGPASFEMCATLTAKLFSVDTAEDSLLSCLRKRDLEINGTK